MDKTAGEKEARGDDTGTQSTWLDGAVERARRAGVSRAENLPFLLEPQHPPQAGVLLVHGFTASPWEMRLFAEELAKAGFAALGVRLPGHGTSPEDLAGRRWEEWREAVEEGRRALLDRGLRTYGVGMSTGSLLLLALEGGTPMAGQVLLSPYLRLRHRLAPAAGLLRFVHPFQRRPMDAARSPFYYDRRPVSGVYQLGRLIGAVRSRLAEATTPTLLLGAAGDRTVHVDSAYDLFRRLGSRRKECHFFGPEVPHILATRENPRWREALDLTREFLADLERQRCSGS